MSLYDGLGIEEKGGGNKDKKVDVSGWGSSLKMLQTQKHLQAKNRASVNQPRKRQSATLPPVMNLRRSGNEAAPLTFNLKTGKLERPTSGTPPLPLNILPEAQVVDSLTGVLDEYNPLLPNDYEEFSKRRRLERKQEDRRKEAERRENSNNDDRNGRRRGRGRNSNYDSDSDEEQSEYERRRKRREEERGDDDRNRRGGVAIAPPSSLIEEDKSANPQDEDDMSPPRPGLGGSGSGFGLFGGSVASKIMAKMGYKQGQGLGKKEQGMSTALQVEKTSKRGGKIIHERDIPKVPDVPEPQAQTNANLLKNPTKVILLRNMVGPGEVDEDLEPETAEECTKYGKVLKCIIFEMPGAVEEEAVRIYVEFERMESAIKAVVDLNGRFFGGRIVNCCFYNLDKFRRLDLADPV